MVFVSIYYTRLTPVNTIKSSVVLCLTLVSWFVVSALTTRVPFGLHLSVNSDVVTPYEHMKIHRRTLTDLHCYSLVSGCCVLGSKVTCRSARSDILPVLASTALLHCNMFRTNHPQILGIPASHCAHSELFVALLGRPEFHQRDGVDLRYSKNVHLWTNSDESYDYHVLVCMLR